jgi:hypothetical protein
MMLKCITLIFATTALAGCCVSGNGCYAPLPAAPDGLGSPPTDNETEPIRNGLPDLKQESLSGLLMGRRRTPNPTARQVGRGQAADQDADAKLKQQMKTSPRLLPGMRPHLPALLMRELGMLSR